MRKFPTQTLFTLINNIMALDPEKLYSTVVAVRAAQKEYFRLQKQGVERKEQLEKCKALEHELDKMLELEKKERLAYQTELFR